MEQTTPLKTLRGKLLNHRTHTYGYGDTYPLPGWDSSLKVDDTNRKSGVYHEDEQDVHAFDSTGFGHGDAGSKLFNKMLTSIGLGPENDYYRVFRDMGRGKSKDYDEAFVYIWANEDVMISTTVNPLTGENGWGCRLNNYHGTAGYVSVTGTEPGVETAVSAIRNYAQIIEAEAPKRRSF